MTGKCLDASASTLLSRAACSLASGPLLPAALASVWPRLSSRNERQRVALPTKASIEGGEKGRASGMRMSKESLTIDEFYVSSSDDEDGESGGAGVAASAPMDLETCLDSLYASNDEEEA